MSEIVPAKTLARRSILHLRRRAERRARRPEQLARLTARAFNKLRAARPHLKTLRRDLPVLIRLVRAYASGSYQRVPWRGTVAAVAAILYFLMPLDAIPDFIPVIGFLDDAAVIAYVMRLLGSEVSRFAKWERTSEP